MLLARKDHIKVPDQAQVKIHVTDLILEKYLSKRDITGQIGSKAITLTLLLARKGHNKVPDQAQSKSISLTLY